MVRVNHPPGGESKLHSETRREPKTVRVLKPPGGGSSISFTDDDSTRRPVRNGSQASSQVEASSPATPTASSDVAPDFDCNATKDAPSVEEASAASPVFTNGTTPEISNEPSSPRESSPPPSSPQNTPVEASIESEVASAVSSVENDAPCVVPTSDLNVEASSEVVEVCSDVSREEASSSTVEVTESESHVETSEEQMSSVQTNGHKSEVEVNTSEEKVSCPLNGHEEVKEKISLTPLTIQDNCNPPQNSPSSPLTPSSPVAKTNEPTKDRVMSQAAAGAPSTQTPPRKIKDHMRSNIFMSDEDYTPTRSSRMNASVTATTTTNSSQNVPAAGQRQRIPPGGFSTKLW